MDNEQYTWSDLIKEVVMTEEVKIKIRYIGDKEQKRLERICRGDWIDLYTNESITLRPGDFRLIDLGVVMKLPAGYEAIIAPRSSTFKKYGIIQTNSIGIIDNTYCGNDDVWKLPVYATRTAVIPKNTRLCQFRIIKNQPRIDFEEVDRMDDENRGGFGSTGV